MKTKVYFYNHDFNKQSDEIICREADINSDGSAIVHYGPSGPHRSFRREAGDYILADKFNNLWRRALEQKARAMAKEMKKEQENEV